MSKKKLKSKPKLSVRDKASLRRIMKTVRNIRVWNSQHK
jgi:hypothetical protein